VWTVEKQTVRTRTAISAYSCHEMSKNVFLYLVSLLDNKNAIFKVVVLCIKDRQEMDPPLSRYSFRRAAHLRPFTPIHKKPFLTY